MKRKMKLILSSRSDGKKQMFNVLLAFSNEKAPDMDELFIDSIKLKNNDTELVYFFDGYELEKVEKQLQAFFTRQMKANHHHDVNKVQTPAQLTFLWNYE